MMLYGDDDDNDDNCHRRDNIPMDASIISDPADNVLPAPATSVFSVSILVNASPIAPSSPHDGPCGRRASWGVVRVVADNDCGGFGHRGYDRHGIEAGGHLHTRRRGDWCRRGRMRQQRLRSPCFGVSTIPPSPPFPPPPLPPPTPASPHRWASSSFAVGGGHNGNECDGRRISDKTTTLSLTKSSGGRMCCNTRCTLCRCRIDLP